MLAVCQHCKLKGKLEQPFQAINWNAEACPLIIKCLRRVPTWWTNWFFYFSLKNFDFSLWKLCHLSVTRKRSVSSCNFVKSKLKALGSQTTDSLVTQWFLQVPHPEDILQRKARSSGSGVGTFGKGKASQGNHVSGICTPMSSDKPLGAVLFLSHSKHGYPTQVHHWKWGFQICVVCMAGDPWCRGTHSTLWAPHILPS